MSKLLVAPFQLHERLLQFVEREMENARRGLPAKIIAKINSLAERKVIEALYRASQAGVQIDLIVRGICCLRPGIKDLSENISVRSVVDRFLEHSRVYYFENACQPQVFLGSADWLPRNFFRRIELVFPIEDGVLRERIMSQLLTVSLADNTRARFLQPDGSYRRPKLAKNVKPRRSQFDFISLADAKPEAPGQIRSGTPKYPQLKPADSPFERP
jgi:polyphosphate kinase